MTDQTATSAAGGDGGAGATAQQAADQNANSGGQTNVDQEWYSGFDEDTRGWMENRGLTKMDQAAALENAVKGFRNAEKYVGTPHEQLLKVPDFDKADSVELDQFFTKLGRPDAPDKYDLKVPEGQSGEFADFAKTMFHEAGLTDRQAKLINEKWNEYVGQTEASQLEAYQDAVQQQDKALRQEWGQAYDQQIDAAKAAARGLGLGETEINAMEKALGFDGLMKMMSNIGGKLGEDTFVTGGGSNGGFGDKTTPAGAKARITQLQNDKEWTAKYLAGNVQARAEMEKLMEMAYPS